MECGKIGSLSFVFDLRPTRIEYERAAAPITMAVGRIVVTSNWP
jgi:hypothetical protein